MDRTANLDVEHPATLLWRTIEIRKINEAFGKFTLEEPILDLGCAEGKIAASLFPRRRIFGLDKSGQLLSQNKQENTYKGLILSDACCMALRSGAFGSVFSNSVIEHISDLKSLLAEVSRILKDKGLFIFTVPSSSLSDYLYFAQIFRNLRLPFLGNLYATARNRQLSHFHLLSAGEWEDALQNTGLRLIYKAHYLSQKDIYLWDKICLFLRFAKYLSFFYGFLQKRFLAQVKKILAQDSDYAVGAALLIVGRKEG